MLLRTILIGFLSAVAGVILTLAVWHVWVDHQQFHALINMLVQQQQQQGAPAPVALPEEKK